MNCGQFIDLLSQLLYKRERLVCSRGRIDFQMRTPNIFLSKCFGVVGGILFFSTHLASANGVGAGGGGSRISTGFRLNADDLISEISENAAANRLCPSATMKKALDRSKIDVVDVLIDLNTGKPVTNIRLDAWSRPGNVELRRTSWSGALQEDGRLDPGVNPLILHELYRTTGTCDDDTGALSSRVATLLKRPSDVTAVYSFTSPEKDLSISVSDGPTDASSTTLLVDAGACERPLREVNKSRKVVCMIASANGHNSAGWYSAYFVIGLADGTSAGDGKLLLDPVLVHSSQDFTVEHLITFLKLVTPSRPYYISIDPNYGDAYGGTELSSLVPLY